MPREGVPYPHGLLCSLRNRIGMIADALNEKLHSINGVEGDGNGNIKLTSAHAGVVISEDALNNEVKIGLDTSELPAANVTSVQGKTGTVVLGADEIPSGIMAPGNFIDDDLSDLKTDVAGNTAAISAEATARANADAALQTNINAEALTRSTTDAGLQNQIDTLPTFSDVSDALDNYASMIRTTGNQSKSGEINFVQTGANAQITKKRSDASYPSTQNRGIHLINVYSSNDTLVARLYISLQSDGTTLFGCEVKNSNGTTKDVVIARGDVI